MTFGDANAICSETSLGQPNSLLDVTEIEQLNQPGLLVCSKIKSKYCLSRLSCLSSLSNLLKHINVSSDTLFASDKLDLVEKN